MTMTSNEDDWKVDVDACHKPVTPVFIRLFIINRVLQLVPVLKNKSKTQKNQAIQSLLTSVLQNKTDQVAAFTVLSELSKNGIKKYMISSSNDNDIDSDNVDIIEQIFNKLILTKFDAQYTYITTYTTKRIAFDTDNCNYNAANNKNTNSNLSYDDDYINTSIVINTNDLMSLIFQFLQFEYLKNCSLVCSHWLYHSFNPNSIYHLNLSYIFQMKYKVKKTTTVWYVFNCDIRQN